MSDTETETMQDTTRGRGASFSKAECAVLKSAMALAITAQSQAEERAERERMLPSGRRVLTDLLDKCERGAGL